MSDAPPRLSNRDFERHVREGNPPTRPCRVIGDVSLHGAVISNHLELHGTVFAGHVSFAECSVVGSLSFKGCDFQAGVDLGRIDVKGDLGFENVRAAGISAHDAKIGRDVTLAFVELRPNAAIRDYVKAVDLTGLSARRVAIRPPESQPSPYGSQPDRRMTIDGPLLLANLTCRELEVARVDAKAIDLSAASITRIKIKSVKCKGFVQQDFSEISLNLEKSNTVEISISDFASEKEIRMNSAKFNECRLMEVRTDGGLFFTKSEGFSLHLWRVIAASVYLSEASIFVLIFQGTYIDGDIQGGGFSCDLLRFTGELQAPAQWANSSEESREFKDLDSNYIRGNLHFWSSNIRSEVLLEAIDVSGYMTFSMCTLGNFRTWSPVSTKEKTQRTFQRFIGSLLLFRNKITDGCDICEVTIGGKKQTARDGGLILRDCEIGGQLSFWRRYHSENDERWTVGMSDANARCRVTGEVQVYNCTIGRDLELTNLEVTHSVVPERPEEGLNGGIVLRRSQVIGEIKFRVVEGQQGATADMLDMRDMEARDVDLAGLTLRAPSDEEVLHAAEVDLAELSTAAKWDMAVEKARKTYKGRIGHVMAQSARVHRDFRLAGLYRSAEIPGAFHLNSAHIGHLLVTADGFARSASRDAKVDGIILREATIQHLEMPCRQRTAECNGFPVPLDLSDCEIRAWSFPRESGDRNESDYQKASDYLDALDNDVTFSRGVYRSVASKLREEGRMEAALRIHVVEQYRAFWDHRRSRWSPGAGRLWPPLASMPSWLAAGLRERWRGLPAWLASPFWSEEASATLRAYLNPKEAFSRIWDRFNGAFLRYGASPRPLFFLILALALTSLTLVAADSRNFELTAANRQLIATQDRREAPLVNLAIDTRACRNGKVIGPRPGEWTTFDALWMTLRYHVPIVSIVARDDVVPTDDRGIMPAVRRVAEVLGAREKGSGAEPAAFWTERADGYADTNCHTSDPNGTSAAAADDNKGLINPEDWFQTMAILNWIMWPLLITGLLQRLVIQQR